MAERFRELMETLCVDVEKKFESFKKSVKELPNLRMSDILSDKVRTGMKPSSRQT